jgi:plasmid stability protein
MRLLHIDALMHVCYTEFVTRGAYMRTTITLNDKIYKALRIRAAESGETVSALVEDAVKEQVLEDLDDLQTVKKRENEPAIDFKVFVKDLKADGLI